VRGIQGPLRFPFFAILQMRSLEDGIWLLEIEDLILQMDTELEKEQKLH
jgi:hypothetical protein